MRNLLTFLLLYVPFLGYGHVELRELWFKLDDENQKKHFISLALNIQAESPIIEAYKAAATMMKAEFTSFPNEKLEFFNLGKRQLEQCLSTNPWNTECRFIRLTLQCKSPWFLGYHDNISEDAQVIVNHFKLHYVTLQNSFWRKAVAFIKVQSHVPDSIKTQLPSVQ